MKDKSSRSVDPEGVGTRLRLPAVLGEEVREHAIQEYPDECCGVLLGTREVGLSTVVAVRPAANLVSLDRTRQFEMDPLDLLGAIREGRGRSLDLLGFYHSHPHGDPTPSRSDLEGSWPGTSAVVVPVTVAGCLSLRSYRLVRGERPAEEILEEAF